MVRNILLWAIVAAVVLTVAIIGMRSMQDNVSDPNFVITANTDFPRYNRKVDVLGIMIYAAKKVENAKLLHAANVLAQYLDNDEDGAVDNPLVLQKMLENKATLFMWKRQSDLENLPKDIVADIVGQDLGADETVPNFVSNGLTGRFDASLEEIWHLITLAGYAAAYPSIFGTVVNTSLTNAMDLARGGRFIDIPMVYPAHAWYTYYDTTCQYDCQAGEYIYWAMSSILGAQKNRLSAIEDEWKLNTKAKLQSQDAAIYQLLTEAQYQFPTVLPDGTYRH